MFTGIVQEVGKVVMSRDGKLTVSAAKVLEGLELGASIGVNGACLTVTHFDSQLFSVDVMPETLKRSNLGLLKAGDKVNLERPMALGGELGGHLVQGHVDATGKAVSIKRVGESTMFEVEAPAEIMRYIVEKGFIAVDGVSLTVIGRTENSFQVSIVGYTKENTIMGERRVGDTVNIEVDIIAKYVEQLYTGRPSGITKEMLAENGFLD